MVNQLFRIGILVYDLERGKEFVPDYGDDAFFEEEFHRISLAVGNEWLQRSVGYQYVLEFHKMEALRLMELVVKMDGLQSELAQQELSDLHLQNIYTGLIIHFIELTRRLDKMIGDTDPYAPAYGD